MLRLAGRRKTCECRRTRASGCIPTAAASRSLNPGHGRAGFAVKQAFVHSVKSLTAAAEPEVCQGRLPGLCADYGNRVPNPGKNWRPGQPQTLPACAMNGAPPALVHGAPLRLRLGTSLGFKMVKYLRALEVVADCRAIGQGREGWREDFQSYSREAGI